MWRVMIWKPSIYHKFSGLWPKIWTDCNQMQIWHVFQKDKHQTNYYLELSITWRFMIWKPSIMTKLVDCDLRYGPIATKCKFDLYLKKIQHHTNYYLDLSIMWRLMIWKPPIYENFSELWPQIWPNCKQMQTWPVFQQEGQDGPISLTWQSLYQGKEVW